MKKVETTKYICEICGAEFGSEQEALHCEEQHRQIKRIAELYYNSDKRYPYCIKIQYDDNEIIVHRR